MNRVPFRPGRPGRLLLLTTPVVLMAVMATALDVGREHPTDAAPAQPAATIVAMIDDFEGPDWPPPDTWYEIDDIEPPPEGKRTYVYDTLTRGLCIGVTPRGTKSFYLYRKIEGRADRIRIGPYPDLTIEAARGKAAEYNAMIAKGINPRDEIRGSRREWTLGRLFQDARQALVYALR